MILDAVTDLFDRIVDKNLLIRRMNISVNRVVDEPAVQKTEKFEQLDFFTDYEALQDKKAEEEAEFAREKKIQKTVLDIKKKHGIVGKRNIKKVTETKNLPIMGSPQN